MANLKININADSTKAEQALNRVKGSIKAVDNEAKKGKQLINNTDSSITATEKLNRNYEQLRNSLGRFHSQGVNNLSKITGGMNNFNTTISNTISNTVRLKNELVNLKVKMESINVGGGGAVSSGSSGGGLVAGMAAGAMGYRGASKAKDLLKGGDKSRVGESIAKAQDWVKNRDKSGASAYNMAKGGIFTQETIQKAGTFRGLMGSLIPVMGAFSTSAAAIAGPIGLMGAALAATITPLSLMGDKLRTQETAFQNLATSYGVASSKIIKDLQEVSNHTMSQAELMETASSAMLLGIPAEEMAGLMEIAVAASKVMGTEVTKNFSDIALGVGRGSVEILDNLGITLKLEEAYDKYAKQLGRSVESLSAAEKKQAILNATLEEGALMVNAVGKETGKQVDGLKKAKAAWADFINAFAKAVSHIFSPAINYIFSQIAALLRYLTAVTDRFIAWKTGVASGTWDLGVDELKKQRDEALLVYRGLATSFGEDKVGTIEAKDKYKALDDIYNRKLLTTSVFNERNKTDLETSVPTGDSSSTEDTIKKAEDKAKQIQELNDRVNKYLISSKMETDASLLDLSGKYLQADLLRLQMNKADEYETLYEHAEAIKELEELTGKQHLELKEQIGQQSLLIQEKYLEEEKALRQRHVDEALEDYFKDIDALQEELQGQEPNLGPWKTYMNEMTESVKNFQHSVEEIAVYAVTDFSEGFGNAFMDFIEGTKSAEQAFKEFAVSFLRQVARMIVQALILKAIQMAIGFAGGTTTAAASTSASSLGGSLGSLNVSPAANGGIALGGWTPFASGGIVTKPTLGLVGEGKESEAILPLSKLDSMLKYAGGGNGGGVNMNLNVVVDNKPGSSPEQAAEYGRMIGKAIEEETMKVLVRESRQGGLLNKQYRRTI